jgi:membrane protein implicated in regulation of membrane protease activity
MAARDPYRYRPFISIGIIGKAITVIALSTNWLLGWMEWPLLLFGVLDAIYVLLFWRFLRANPV